MLHVCLFDLILYVPSTIFQLNRDGSSWVEPVLSLDKCVLLKDHNALRRHCVACNRKIPTLGSTVQKETWQASFSTGMVGLQVGIFLPDSIYATPHKNLLIFLLTIQFHIFSLNKTKLCSVPGSPVHIFNV